MILQKVHLQQPCYDFCFLERSNIGQICSFHCFLFPGVEKGRHLRAFCEREKNATTGKQLGKRNEKGGSASSGKRSNNPCMHSFFSFWFSPPSGKVPFLCFFPACAPPLPIGQKETRLFLSGNESPLVFITSSSVATTGGVYKWQRHQSAQADDLFVLGIPL